MSVMGSFFTKSSQPPEQRPFPENQGLVDRWHGGARLRYRYERPEWPNAADRVSTTRTEVYFERWGWLALLSYGICC